MRLCLAHALEHLRHQAGMHGLQHANGNGAQRMALKVTQRFTRTLQTVEQRQRVVVQRVGGQGGQQAFAAALEEGDVEVVFELADLL